MNIFDVTDPDEYVRRTKLRQKDSSSLAQNLQYSYRTGSAGGLVPVILDIGCGTGYSTLELAVRFPHSRVIGIDSNPSLIDAAPIMSSNVEFYCFDISVSAKEMERFSALTDLGECSVSIAVSTYWISSLTTGAQHRALENVRHLLKPGSRLYLLDLIWTQLSPIIYGLNRTPKWSEIIESHRQRIIETIDEDSTVINVDLLPGPPSDKPPTMEQINNHWLSILERHQELELIQLFLYNRTYEFESIDDLFTVLESLCPVIELDSDTAHRYLVEFIRQSFDLCFCSTKQLLLPYHCLLVTVGRKFSDNKIHINYNNNYNNED